VEAYRAAVAIKPRTVRAHVEMAASLLALARHADAEAACREAIAIDPETARAHYLLWDALEAQAKHAALEEAARAVLALQPDHPDARARLRRARAARGLTEA
jgi:tetratricopeptide (TPR) repeat protein